VECDSIPSADTLTASDSCGSASVVFDETTSPGACPNAYTITRTWTATDECGNDTVHIQTLTVEDTTDPTFNEALPVDATVECDNIPPADVLTATDGCTDTSAAVVFDENTTAGSCPNSYTITRHWAATDACGNVENYMQTITVEDNTNPSWTIEPSDVLAECNAGSNTDFNAWLNSFSGSDNCGSAVVTHNSLGLIDCGESEIVIFTLTDECGNFITKDAEYAIEDTLGFEENDIESILMYPNPAKDHIIIKGLRDTARIKVYNLAGQKVMETETSNGQAVYFDIASGLYLVKVVTLDGSITKKLIIE
ncbi:MAG: T9SS type A sorting domain-containing protein, partial [Bacteroidia bacterium]|nr:T9SS type A sorting domain-containing protein [Bacteroidia bacterium]